MLPRTLTGVSVCIRTHDRPDSLRDAVTSVLDQRHAVHEVIVADDGAVGCSDVVDSFRDDRIRYQRLPPSSGPAATLRSGLNAAGAPFLAVLDDDDRWHPDFLASVLAAFEADRDLGLVFSDYYLVIGEHRARRGVGLCPGRHDDLLNEILMRSPIAPSAAVFRRRLWDEGEAAFPLLDHALGAATIFISAAAAGWPMFYVDEPLMDYRLHAEQAAWKPDSLRKAIATLERFSFDDERCEATRRNRLAHARMAVAGCELRAGRARHAAHSVRAARRALQAPLAPAHWLSLSGVRRDVMRSLLGRPQLLFGLRTAWLTVRRAVSHQS
jgi:glycosyltransferase involved in cell wall biosynthesis